MRFFIASPWKNKDQVEQLSEKLTRRGYEVYSFLLSGANLAAGISIGDELKMFNEALGNWQQDADIKRIFDSEMEGLKGSDALILLGPVGRSSLIEAGIAYGLGKKVFIVGSVEKPEVFYLICDNLYADIDSFLGSLPPARQ